MEKKDSLKGSWGMTIIELEERLRATLPNHGGKPLPRENLEGKIVVTFGPSIPVKKDK